MKTKLSKYANPDIDRAIPELVPEVIASRATHDRKEQEILCVRLRHHWETNQGFRDSFKRKDPRDVCFMWMAHWSEAERKTQLGRKKP
jgi:hypothetical protein